jgi:type I restriction enzyme S subunit
MTAVEKARAAAEAQLQAAKALPAAYLREVFPAPDAPLPQGWRWVKLGEVCSQDRTILAPEDAEAKKRDYLGLERIESQTGRILPLSFSTEEGISTTFAYDSRHVLYGKLRPYLNKVALPTEAGRCTTELIPLLPTADIRREYLAWLLRREETTHAAMQEKTGSRMPRADMETLLRLEVPLPPLPEQRRIAGILKEQMAAVEKARAAAEAQLSEINALPAALLRQAFSGQL